jgi:hypothetical protein
VFAGATETRLAELCARMRALEWRRGETGAEYQAKWKLSRGRVEHLAAEAWRRVKAEATDVDRITTKISSVLEQVIDDAMLETHEPAMIDGGEDKGVYQESPNGARRVVVDAAKTWAAIVGANAPTKIDQTITPTGPAVQIMLMTPDETEDDGATKPGER